MSCEQNEPVRCVLRLFGASALGVQQAASAFPPEWCVTAQCRSRGAETLIALRSENAAGLDKARRSLHGCFAVDLYGEGDTNLAAAVVQALEHRRRLLVCADAAAGALMEARLEAVPGAEKVFDFGTQSYADPKVGAQIARRAARRQDAAAALARVQAAQHLVGAELSAGCWEQDGKFLLLLGTRKGCWLRTVYREDGPGLWLLDMIRRAACGLPQVPARAGSTTATRCRKRCLPRLQRRRRSARLRPKRSAAGCAGCCCCWWRWPWPRWRRAGGSPAAT